MRSNQAFASRVALILTIREAAAAQRPPICATASTRYWRWPDFFRDEASSGRPRPLFKPHVRRPRRKVECDFLRHLHDRCERHWAHFQLKLTLGRPIMQTRMSLFLAMATTLSTAGVIFPACAKAPSAIATSGLHSTPTKGGAPDRSGRSAIKSGFKHAAPLPCARAKWKDDPVCFGEGDSSALPVPSARALGSSEPSAQTRKGDIAVFPKSSLSQSSNEPRYGSGPNPIKRGRGVGGGIGLIYHF